MRLRFLGWTAPVILVALLGATPRGTPASFSMILVRDGSTWRATCESGCRWSSVSAGTGWFQSSRVLIDNTGIKTRDFEPDSAATFAFRVTTDGSRGWKATGLKGTAWQEVSFTCPRLSCRARLTEAGVEGAQ